MNQNIVILTGAGISADSGIATFRASDGLWENHRVEEVATPEGFAHNPALVQQFYNERREDLLSPSIRPNPAHYALTELQEKSKGRITIVTQNIDDLHERAGSKNVLHMHGELLKVRCVKSGKVQKWDKPMTDNDRCQCCNTPQVLRPHIVWFGEIPFYMDQIQKHLSEADLFIAIGTSGNVYPAAGYVSEAKSRGIPTLEINLEPGTNRTIFDQSIYGRAAIEVPKWVENYVSA